MFPIKCYQITAYTVNAFFLAFGMCSIIYGAIWLHSSDYRSGVLDRSVSSVACVVIGCVYIIVSTSGVCGVVFERLFVLKVYIIFLVLSAIVFGVVTISVFGFCNSSIYVKYLKDRIKIYFDQCIEQRNLLRCSQVEVLQVKYGCCGYNDPSEWAKANLQLPPGCFYDKYHLRHTACADQFVKKSVKLANGFASVLAVLCLLNLLVSGCGYKIRECYIEMSFYVVWRRQNREIPSESNPSLVL